MDCLLYRNNWDLWVVQVHRLGHHTSHKTKKKLLISIFFRLLHAKSRSYTSVLTSISHNGLRLSDNIAHLLELSLTLLDGPVLGDVLNATPLHAPPDELHKVEHQEHSQQQADDYHAVHEELYVQDEITRE